LAAPRITKKKIDYTDNELSEIIRRCTKFGRAPKLIDGKFFACGQNGYALYEELSDFVDIRNCLRSELEDKIYYYVLKSKRYDICRYCRGQFDNCEKIPPAEQMDSRSTQKIINTKLE